MSLTTPIFELEKVTYSYGDSVVALAEVDVVIRPGERVAILGANGSGKSTLLKILDGLYFPTAGRVKAFGQPLSEELFQDEEYASTFRRRVGLVFQDPDVQLFLPTVWEEVTFAPLQLGLPQDEVVERAEWALDFLGIGKLRERSPHRLSEGEKKKVALASVLSLQPDVWLMDEPTASLDPRSQSHLIDFIIELGEQGKTIVTTTHDLTIVSDIADRAYVFCEHHRILGQGPPTEILADQDLLLECNLIHVHRHVHCHAHGELKHRHAHPPGERHEHAV
ncbi:MAG: energy-coupling factor ABC transporter ATP-binding protein [Anaerolineae bacterium]